jgi:hypothetical protein
MILSCSSRQVIDVSENGDIHCKIEIELTKMFADYIRDLSDAAGTGAAPESYFDTQQIRSAFSSLEGVKLEKISSGTASKPELKLAFSVENNAESLKGIKGANPAGDEIFSFSESSGIKKISFYLDRINYRKISSAFAFEDNPVLAGLTPQPDNPYSGEEYLELVDYVFSEYTSDAASVIKNSFVDIEINVKGKIQKAEGGKIKGNSASFRIPVINFLTLYNPVHFEIEYR